jgi:putative transposase
MRTIIELLIHLLCTLFTLLKPAGVKVVIAENLAMKQQLIVMWRGNKRSPKLITFDRFFFGFICFFVSDQRIRKIAVILKPVTILRFHKALCQRKYRRFYSSKTKKKPGRKGPEQQVIDLIIEMRTNNPRIGYGRISMQVYQTFGVEISRFTVGRIIRQYFKNNPSKNDGPSWLTCIGHMKDSLWSVDLFRCESITLKSHWVMVIMDQYTRRIIGFAVNAGDYDGVAYCRMFNKIISGKDLPKYISTDNDPIFLFHRWQANLRVLDVEEIKSVPRTPVSQDYASYCTSLVL